jgi:integrase
MGRKACAQSCQKAWRLPDFGQSYGIPAGRCENAIGGDEAMPLKVYRPKGSNVFHYRGTLAGNRLRGSTGATERSTAQRIAAEVEARFWQRGIDKKELTFPKAVALYLAAGKPDRFIAKLEDYWKDTKVSAINAGLIKQSAHELYPGTSGATKNRQVIVPMQAIINHCAEMGLCDHLKMSRFDYETEIKKPVTREWIRDFCAYAVGADLASLAIFLFSTGARISEALAVRWSDVDFKNRQVRIRQTKLGNERIAHLPTDTFIALANLPRDLAPFPRPFSTYVHQWNRTIEAAGIEHLSFHSCRHGFATGLLRAGIDVMTVAKLGGWKSAQHVFQTYGHANDDPTLTDRLFEDSNGRQIKESSRANEM